MKTIFQGMAFLFVVVLAFSHKDAVKVAALASSAITFALLAISARKEPK